MHILHCTLLFFLALHSVSPSFPQRLLGGLSKDKEFLASLVGRQSLRRQLQSTEGGEAPTSGALVESVAKEALTSLQVCCTWLIVSVAVFTVLLHNHTVYMATILITFSDTFYQQYILPQTDYEKGKTRSN